MRGRCSGLAAVLAVALTAGCATTTRVVQVPVPVPCLARADLPDAPVWLMDALPEDASAAEVVRAAGSDLLTAAQYGATLRALLLVCVD